MTKTCRLAVASILASLALLLPLHADDAPATDAGPPPKALVDMSSPGAAAKFVPDDQANGQVTVTGTTNPAGVMVTVAPGTSSYPGVWVHPDGAPWDLSSYGHIEAKITNLSSDKLVAVIRLSDGTGGGQLDNGDKFVIKPGETRVCKALFGYSWGMTVNPINTKAVTQIQIFTGKNTSAAPVSYRIESLDAAGPAGEKLPVNPANVATKPPGGVIYSAGATLDPKQLSPTASSKGAAGADGIDVTLTGANSGVTVKPPMGVWRLSDQLEVKVKVKNTGSNPVTPSVRLESRPGPSDTIAASAPIAPGAEAEIVVPFRAAVPWKGLVDADQQKVEVKKNWGGEPNAGTQYASCFATGITVLGGDSADAKSLRITSIIADMPPVSTPDWLGTKPPVDGEWAQTLNENFEGNSLDLHRWNIYSSMGPFHIGAQTHYTKDNVIVKDGTLSLRAEYKPGYHNDDPTQVKNDIATGYADTYGKWTQRYGYFEAKMKLPRAANMFNAFWLMPDRGIDTPTGQWGQQAARADTKGTGMEFDIMETLAIWGPWRHDWGMHWDGYNKYHKSNGYFTAYSEPDKDGYITVGMLWVPGKVTMYDNGKESASWETPRVGSEESHIILDNVTGGWEAEPMDLKQLPSDMVFKYIRVWQRKDLASPGDGPKPNDGGPNPPTKPAGTPAK